MTQKIPLSLRGPACVTAKKTETAPSRIGVFSAACLASALPLDSAFAQSTPGQLPALNVEAPAEIRKPKPRKVQPATRTARPARPRAAPRSAAAAAPAAAGPVVASGGASGPGAPGANPYADPAAPYKVDRLQSPKLTQPVLDTPRTVTAIPKEVIEDKQATSFRELVRTTPGLTLGSGEGGNAFGDRVFIRGFDARNDIYVDGVRDPGVGIRETFATEQVEVLKGPAAIVGGRGTAGGAVNFVTKQPQFVNFGNVTTTFGTDNTKRVAVDVNGTVTPEFAVRANGLFQDANVAGRDYVFDNRWGGLVAGTWKPVENFKFTLDYYHVDIDQLPDWGVPFDARSRRPLTESGLRRDAFYGVVARDFQKYKQDIVSATADWQVNEAIGITSKTRYGFGILDYVAGAPNAPNFTTNRVTSSAKSRYQENEVVVNQTDITAKFVDFMGWKHTFVTGFELSSENVLREGYAGLATESFGQTPNASANFDLFNPNSRAVLYNGTPTRTFAPTLVKVNTMSAYALDTININDILFLTGGLRIDDYDVSARSLTAAGFQTSFVSRHDDLLNGNIGITYKPLPNVAVYAAFGTSSNPVGSELDGNGVDYGGLTAANAVVGPEKNKAYEVGTKWELFDRRLLATVALFKTVKENAREQVGAAVLGTGQYEVQGVEVGFTGKITDRWSLFGGAVFMGTEVTRSAVAANVGHKLANVAEESYNVLTKYDITDKLTVGGGATYIGRILGGTFAANENVLPGKWRFDALAEYRFTDKISAKLNVNNIFDTVIYDAFYRSGTPYVFLAPGRVAYLSLSFKY